MDYMSRWCACMVEFVNSVLALVWLLHGGDLHLCSATGLLVSIEQKIL
jgi:hypothetical protein